MKDEKIGEFVVMGYDGHSDSMDTLEQAEELLWILEHEHTDVQFALVLPVGAVELPVLFTGKSC